VKLRLHGTPAEAAAATRRLLEVLEVVSPSGPYPDRGASVRGRVDLEVRLDPPPSAPPASPGRPARRQGRARP
jgi:hypothetical protein